MYVCIYICIYDGGPPGPPLPPGAMVMGTPPPTRNLDVDQDILENVVDVWIAFVQEAYCCRAEGLCALADFLQGWVSAVKAAKK